MMSPSPAEVVLFVTSIGATFRWWFDRRDSHSALSVAKTAAESAVVTLKDALLTKNDEINELKQAIRELKDDHLAERQLWQSEREGLMDRISHLEILRAERR